MNIVENNFIAQKTKYKKQVARVDSTQTQFKYCIVFKLMYTSKSQFELNIAYKN